MKIIRKLNINYWLRKVYTSNLYQIFFSNNHLKKKVFTSIYKSNHWAQSDNLSGEIVSVSGPGSNINQKGFLDLKKNFENIFKKYEIRSILDMPCGDFLWLNEVIKDKNIYYLGIDIVNELISRNNIKYKNEKINFECRDIVEFFPKRQFDLILIRDLFIHLKNSDITKILNNLKSIDFKYLAVNSNTIEINKDVNIGQHRKINLLIKPFNLKEPMFSINDGEADKFIYFYKKEDLI